MFNCSLTHFFAGLVVTFTAPSHQVSYKYNTWTYSAVHECAIIQQSNSMDSKLSRNWIGHFKPSTNASANASSAAKVA